MQLRFHHPQEERSHLLTQKPYPDSLSPFDPDPRLEPIKVAGEGHEFPAFPQVLLTLASIR